MFGMEQELTFNSFHPVQPFENQNRPAEDVFSRAFRINPTRPVGFTRGWVDSDIERFSVIRASPDCVISSCSGFTPLPLGLLLSHLVRFALLWLQALFFSSCLYKLPDNSLGQARSVPCRPVIYYDIDLKLIFNGLPHQLRSLGNQPRLNHLLYKPVKRKSHCVSVLVADAQGCHQTDEGLGTGADKSVASL